VTPTGGPRSGRAARRAGRCRRGGHQRHHGRAQGCGPHPRLGDGIGRPDVGGTGRRPRPRPVGGLPPLAHIGGLSVVTRSIVTGTPCTVLERFDPTAVELAAARGATLVSLVATALRRCDTSGYRSVLLGGAAPPAGLPDNVVTTYGLTETGSGCIYDGRPLDGSSSASATARSVSRARSGARPDAAARLPRRHRSPTARWLAGHR